MKSVQNGWFSVNFIFTVLILGGILLVYLSNEFPPQKVHVFILLPLLIPVFVILNIFLIILYLPSFKKNYIKAILFILLFLFGGFKYLVRTFQWSLRDKSTDQINIISYNVKVFNAYRTNDDAKSQNLRNSIDWIKKSDAQIACIQEYYTNKKAKDLNTARTFKKKFPYICIIPYYNIPPQQIGLAILSKYKIIKSGEIKFKSSTFNQAIFADVKIDKNKILRVYNIHLQSMNINEKVFSEVPERKLLLTTIDKYRNGALERVEQLKEVLNHINNSPYPSIVCGDFNDVPYSFVYEQFRKHLKNGFEEKGNGFGFTYSGKYSFLRIDNIFASKQIKFTNFQTHDSVWGSDHFPISANVFIEN